MKYLCLAYYDDKKFEALSKEDVQALVSQCPAHDEDLRKRDEGHPWPASYRPINCRRIRRINV
jgi:hypothetical protein